MNWALESRGFFSALFPGLWEKQSSRAKILGRTERRGRGFSRDFNVFTRRAAAAAGSRSSTPDGRAMVSDSERFPFIWNVAQC